MQIILWVTSEEWSPKKQVSNIETSSSRRRVIMIIVGRQQNVKKSSGQKLKAFSDDDVDDKI